MRCLTPGENGVIWIHQRAPFENVICGGGGVNGGLIFDK